MPLTTLCKPGDVVLIPFPFTDLTTSKQRPAVVISSEAFNRTHRDVILMAVTSAIPATLAEDDFPLSPGDLASAKLPKPSIVKLGKIVTLDQRLIRKTLGQLSETTFSQLKARFKSAILA